MEPILRQEQQGTAKLGEDYFASRRQLVRIPQAPSILNPTETPETLNPRLSSKLHQPEFIDPKNKTNASQNKNR
tara:strand:- start:4 stop:225 length:222 start_codon:yes stop_codon:yes gene_type:complete